MRIILGLALSLTLVIFTNAGYRPDDDSDTDPDIGSGSGKVVPGSGGLPPQPEHAGEDEPESDLANALSYIFDAISSIISLVEDTATASTAIPYPTAAHPCMSAWDLFATCGAQATSLAAAADSCNVPQDEIVECEENQPAGSSTTPISIYQSSCLCTQSQTQGTSTWGPGVFEGYLVSCNDYVQAQTQLAAQDDLAITTAFCTSASNVNVSPTPAAGSITPTVTPVTSTKPSQTPSSSFTTSAATALSPMMSSGSWYMVWWTVIVLLGSGWAAYS